MSSKVIGGIVAAVIVVGGGVAYMLTQNDDNNAETTSTSQQTTNTNTEQQASTSEYSISELAGMGTAQKCTFKYSGPNGSSDAVMYTDGAGKSRIDMDNVSEQGNTGKITQIVRDGKSYTIVTTAGQKLGFVFDVSQTQNSGSTSSNQGVDPNASFAMNCSAWTVDASQFEIPTDVQFVSTPALGT